MRHLRDSIQPPCLTGMADWPKLYSALQESHQQHFSFLAASQCASREEGHTFAWSQVLIIVPSVPHLTAAKSVLQKPEVK